MKRQRQNDADAERHCWAHECHDDIKGGNEGSEEDDDDHRKDTDRNFDEAARVAWETRKAGSAGDRGSVKAKGGL